MNLRNLLPPIIIKILKKLLLPKQPVPENYTDKVSFNPKSLSDGTQQVYYRGIKTARCPFDYVIYQMILFDLKPDLIIEIGTSEGGACTYYADLMDLIGKGEIHTIDISDNRVNPADEKANHNRVKFFTDGWQNYDLKNAEGFDTILVIDDGAHTYSEVLAALNKFNSLVTLGSYFIVEDGMIDKLGKEVYQWFNGGPNRAIKEFMLNNNSFIIDRKWCDLFGTNATFNTNGYLKKIQ